MEPFWQYFHMTLFVFKHFQKLSLHFSFSFFWNFAGLKAFPGVKALKGLLNLQVIQFSVFNFF